METNLPNCHEFSDRFDVIASDVLSATAAVYGVTEEQILGKGRRERVVEARGAAAAVMYEALSMSYPEIARALGRNSHSGVLGAHHRWRRAHADRPHEYYGKIGAIFSRARVYGIQYRGQLMEGLA